MLGGSEPGPDDFASLNVTRGSAPCLASVLVGEICCGIGHSHLLLG